MKILVVDDEPSYRMLIEDRLKLQGWTVFTAANGEEGLTQLRAITIDVVISDIYMPNMDGLRFLKAARDIPGYENTPFLFVSANDDDQTKAAVQASKNGGFMKKSRPMNELKEWLAYLLLPKERRPSVPPGSDANQSFTRNTGRDDRTSRR